MNTEVINDKAQAYADKIDDGQRTARQCAVKAYIQACNDIADGSMEVDGVWHNASETPQCKGGTCLYCVQGRKGNIRRMNYEGAEQFGNYVRRCNVSQWAYKQDLLDV